MEGKLLRCTYCGAKIPKREGDTVTCPYCDSVNYFRYAEKLGENELAERELKVMRERLHECTDAAYHDFAEMKDISDEILNLVKYDFEAKFFYALALKKSNKRVKYNDFLSSSSNMAPNRESLERVLKNVIRYARENERTLIRDFLKRQLSDPLEYEEYADAADRQIERALKDFHGGQDVFICHKSSDGAAAWEIAERLESGGITCFLSERNLEDLEVGERFESALKEAVASCKIFLFVSSFAAFRRDVDNYVMMEVAAADALNKPNAEFRIAPVDKATEALSPEYEAYFKGCQYIEAYPHPADMLDKLFEHISKKLKRLAGEGGGADNELRAKEEEIERLKREKEEAERRAARILQEKEQALLQLTEIKERSGSFKEQLSGGVSGEADELYREACAYDFGKDKPQDKTKAIVLYRAAAKSGSAPAMYNLGVSYENGDGVEADEFEAARWYLLAAECGHTGAMYNLGNNYRKGRGVPVNYARAFEYLKKAADGGNVDAMTNLGVCYENGEGIEKDTTKAFEWYLKAAGEGDSAAQFNLALCYKSGQGAEKSDALYRYWMEKAADQGDGEAKEALTETAREENSGVQAAEFYRKGSAYDFGEDGLPQDKTKAVYFYTKAAQLGHDLAQLNLGVCYEYGEGVSKNLKTAVKYYVLAAEQGNCTAQCNLGYCYYNGEGVPRDYAKAVLWYKKAAAGGSGRAYNNLGYCYERGDGLMKNLKTAFEMYLKAADMGDVNGICNAAYCYETGTGTVRNLLKAREYNALGREKGASRAVKAYERVENKLMSESDEAKAAFIKACGYDFGENGCKINKSRAVDFYIKAAKLGSVQAMYNLGVCYNQGDGVKKDFGAACSWFDKAAARGHAGAYLNLGAAYERGEGVEKNLKRSYEMYETAARAGNALAQYNCGCFAENGAGTERDLSKAAGWYARAAAQKLPRGMLAYASCLSDGRGAQKDSAKAFSLYRDAAAAGDGAAWFNLGCCYRLGLGVKADLGKAVDCYMKAVDTGYADACFNVAKAYEEGEGVRADAVSAQKWYKKGAAAGDRRCVAALTENAK